MRTPMNTPQRQRGVVLIVSLVLLLIITAIAASTLTSSTFQTVVSNNAQKRDGVLHVAESAAERILPLSNAVTQAAKAAALASTNDGYTSTLATSNQPGLDNPSVKVVYPGAAEGERNAYVLGMALGGSVNLKIRSYEVQGSAQTSDGKVKSTVVMGVAKIEPLLN